MFKQFKKNKGFSLIDSIIGIAIITTVFFTMFGVFRLGISILSNNKAKVGAISLANEQLEFVRSLSYDAVGTISGIPAGNIPQEEEIILNNIKYNRRTFIQYVDSDKDGFGLNDDNSITTDYKSVKIAVSWLAKKEIPKSTVLITTIVPKGVETLEGGGTLVINIFDNEGAPIQGAEVNIINDDLVPPVSITAYSNFEGKVIFPGSPSANNYKIIVTKNNYSSGQTYDVDALNINPNPGHLSVLEGELTEISFLIDLLSRKTIKTFLEIRSGFFEDSFIDSLKLSETNLTEVLGGSLVLVKKAPEEYELGGYAFSDAVKPEYLKEWKNFSFNHSIPVGTDITYHLYFSVDGINYSKIPDTDLVGNSAGFTSSPVNLASLDITTYNDLKMNSSLSTADASTTPSVLDWKIEYDEGIIPQGLIDFNMEGDKFIGLDGTGTQIKKYSENLQTDSSGELIVDNLEWDNYYITINGAGTGYDISKICPNQPFPLEPNTSVITDIYLTPHSNNSLLVSVSDVLGTSLNNADIRLYGGSFDTTKQSEYCGQVFFDSVASGLYSLEVTLSGYEVLVIPDIDISGNLRRNLILENL